MTTAAPLGTPEPATSHGVLALALGSKTIVCTRLSILFSATAAIGKVMHENALNTLVTMLGITSVLAAAVALAPAVEGQFLAEEGLALARWTAWKEYRDECLQAKSQAPASPGCEEALKSELPPPSEAMHSNPDTMSSRNRSYFHLPVYVQVGLALEATMVSGILTAILCHRLDLRRRARATRDQLEPSILTVPSEHHYRMSIIRSRLEQAIGERTDEELDAAVSVTDYDGNEDESAEELQIETRRIQFPGVPTEMASSLSSSDIAVLSSIDDYLDAGEAAETSRRGRVGAYPEVLGEGTRQRLPFKADLDGDEQSLSASQSEPAP